MWFGQRSRDEVREIRDMAIANKTLLDSRINIDVDHHNTVEKGIVGLRNDTDKKHVENNQRFIDVDRNIENINKKMDENVAELHGRITRLGTDVTDKINEKSELLTDKINETSSSLVTQLNGMAWGSVKWISSVVGGILLLGIAIISYLITEGPPWKQPNEKPTTSLSKGAH